MPSLDVFAGDFWLAVLVALVCGGLVGAERQLRGRPTGIRTCSLIALGSMFFARLGAVLQGPGADPARTLGQIVVGVGFLGAGAILTRARAVTGLTSAAVIWVLAGVGSAIGLGHAAAGAAVTLVALLVLVVVGLLEGRYEHLRRGDHARRPLPPAEPG